MSRGTTASLQEELRTHTYRPGRSICFITDGPKPREVFAADFRDRVVHHLLVACQERVFEPIFLHDSYACRKGKGTLAASDRLMTFLRQVTANGRRGGGGTISQRFECDRTTAWRRQQRALETLAGI